MMTRLTLDLPDDLAQSVAILAAKEGRDREAVAVDLLRSSLNAQEQEIAALASLSDSDVLAMADLKLSKREQDRLNQLLEANGEGGLTPDEQPELDELMQAHYDALERKAMGWAEAVRRKLREPLTP